MREGMGVRKGGVEMEEKIYPMSKELFNGRAPEVRIKRSESGFEEDSTSKKKRFELLPLHCLCVCSYLTMCQNL